MSEIALVIFDFNIFEKLESIENTVIGLEFYLMLLLHVFYTVDFKIHILEWLQKDYQAGWRTQWDTDQSVSLLCCNGN